MNAPNLKRQITIGEAIGIGMTVLGAIVAAWVNIQVKLTTLEIREADDRVSLNTVVINNTTSFQQLGKKMDGLSDQLNSIEIQLQNKQDRKN